MQTINLHPKHVVRKLVACTPEQLMELGQKMRAAAMSVAENGDAVIIDFTDRISLIWSPPGEYLRPRPPGGPDRESPVK